MRPQKNSWALIPLPSGTTDDPGGSVLPPPNSLPWSRCPGRRSPAAIFVRRVGFDFDDAKPSLVVRRPGERSQFCSAMSSARGPRLPRRAQIALLQRRKRIEDRGARRTVLDIVSPAGAAPWGAKR